MATLTPSPKMQFIDANGNPLAGGKLYTYASGTTTPLATYTDATGGTPNTNPVILDSAGYASVWLGTSLYTLKLTTSTDALVWTADAVGGVATLSSLAASGGASLIGYTQGGAGAATSTVQAKLRETVSVKDFGAVGDGVTNDAAAFNAALLASKRVYVPTGTYLINSTVSAQQNGNVLYGDGDSSIINYTGAGIAISYNAKQYVSMSDFKLTSTTGTHGVYIGYIAHFFALRRVHVDGQLASVPTGFTTGGVVVERSYYGQIEHCDISYCPVGIYGFREFNGNFVTSNSIRQCLVGIKATDDTSKSDGTSIIGNEIESAAVGSTYGISILGGDNMMVSSNRIEYTVGTAHIYINSNVGTANKNQLIGNACAGTIAGIILGDGVGSAQVNDTMILGGMGISLVVNSDCTYTNGRIGYAAYGSSITNSSTTSFIDYLGALSFSAGITGLTTAPTATFKYSIQGDTVTLWTQILNGTSNSTDCTLTNFPAAIWPRVNTQACIVPIQDNGLYSFGTLQITTGGVVTLSKSALAGTGATFTNVNGKGILSATISWKLN